MLLGWKKQYCENDYTTKHNLQILRDPYQITNGIFHRTRTKKFTLNMETQETLNSQSSLEKKEWSWRNQPSWLQITLQSYSHQDSMVQFSSVLSDSLRPHESQHTRPPVHHKLLEPTQTYVHWVSDAIQPSHPLSSDRKSNTVWTPVTS